MEIEEKRSVWIWEKKVSEGKSQRKYNIGLVTIL